MITAYRKVNGGSGLDGYTTIELLQDGEWVHGATFSQDDDYMSKHMNDYIYQVGCWIHDSKPKKWVITNAGGPAIHFERAPYTHIETRDEEYAMSFVYQHSPYAVHSTLLHGWGS